jgi:hypothetical protein
MWAMHWQHCVLPMHATGLHHTRAAYSTSLLYLCRSPPGVPEIELVWSAEGEEQRLDISTLQTLVNPGATV